MPLTRALFETACRAYARVRHDWVWVERPSPGFGYMHRTVPLQMRTPVGSDALESADDPATAVSLPDHLVCHQSVVFSATFQVPTFYFSVYDTTGSPVGLSDITNTCLFQRHVFDGLETTAFSVGDPASNFPLLSFGDHPCLGSQCWYLHPCETGPAVEEILAAWSDVRPQDSDRWLEAWFLVLSCVVDLGGSHPQSATVA